MRKKKNRSGSVSVQVIDKSNAYRVVKTIGSSKDPEQIRRMFELAKLFIAHRKKQYSLFPHDQQDNAAVLNFVRNIQNSHVRTVGPELILGKIFDQIGFDAVGELLFRDIVIARLVYPTSKAKTVDYLYRYQGKSISTQSIYRFLDRLNDQYSQQAQQIAYEHSLSVLKHITVVFYDMTSLYFENEDEDDLRKIGFSKDGKFQNPQIMLGLLVGRNGYPIGYDIFEGNTFEGKTLLPVLRRIERKYGFGKPVVVADAAMLSNENLQSLEQEQFPYIVGARIRNETQPMQEEILRRCGRLDDGQTVVIDKDNFHRLIVSYSDRRAGRDVYNRQRGLKKLRRKVHSGKLTKEHLNNRGYNKFLRLSGEVKIEIDEVKVAQADRWDGLKGYFTNTNYSPELVIRTYSQLWHVEKAFRISETDLRIRPMYHYRRKRIEAHVLIAFVAYTIYKELERRLAEVELPISPQRAIELTKTMYELRFELPDDPYVQRVLLKMDVEQQMLYGLMC
ncbi:MAG: IS1634 family transposase [Sedimentisphaerales bacterium]|nr:IS1634 family transposase [Sedimentisphaerales bacterium]